MIDRINTRARGEFWGKAGNPTKVFGFVAGNDPEEIVYEYISKDFPPTNDEKRNQNYSGQMYVIERLKVYDEILISNSFITFTMSMSQSHSAGGSLAETCFLIQHREIQLADPG